MARKKKEFASEILRTSGQMFRAPSMMKLRASSNISLPGSLRQDRPVQWMQPRKRDED